MTPDNLSWLAVGVCSVACLLNVMTGKVFWALLMATLVALNVVMALS